MKNINKGIKVSKLAIVFYVFAGLSLIYACYSLYISYDYIASLVKQGSITWGSGLHDIIKYFTSNSAPYVFYTLALGFFGYASNFMAVSRNLEVEQEEVAQEEQDIKEVNEPEQTDKQQEINKEDQVEIVENKEEA